MNPITDENPFDADALSAEEKLRNVARIVIKYTEVKHTRSRSCRRSTTYAADVDAIASAARHLAEDVMSYLDR